MRFAQDCEGLGLHIPPSFTNFATLSALHRSRLRRLLTGFCAPKVSFCDHRVVRACRIVSGRAIGVADDMARAAEVLKDWNKAEVPS